MALWTISERYNNSSCDPKIKSVQRVYQHVTGKNTGYQKLLSVGSALKAARPHLTETQFEYLAQKTILIVLEEAAMSTLESDFSQLFSYTNGVKR